MAGRASTGGRLQGATSVVARRGFGRLYVLGESGGVVRPATAVATVGQVLRER